MEKTAEIYRQFYRRENKRKIFGFFIENEYPLFRYRAAEKLPQGRALKPGDFCVDDYLQDYDRLYELHKSCGGDTVYAASAFWGIPWLEAIMGCEIYANHETGSISAQKTENLNPVFDEKNEWVQLCGEFLEKAKKHSQNRYPLATTRMRGVSDLLAVMYGQDDLIYEMYDNPEKIKASAEKICKLFIDFAKFQLQFIKDDFFGMCGSFYYNVLSPYPTVWHQEDSVALLSPELYEQFIEPWDREIVKQLPSVIMHQHPTGYLAYQKYLDMGMTALELHIDEGGVRAQELNNVYREICAKRPLIIWGKLTKEDLDFVFDKLPSEGIAVIQCVDSPQQAKALLKKYQ